MRTKYQDSNSYSKWPYAEGDEQRGRETCEVGSVLARLVGGESIHHPQLARLHTSLTSSDHHHLIVYKNMQDLHPQMRGLALLRRKYERYKCDPLHA